MGSKSNFFNSFFEIIFTHYNNVNMGKESLVVPQLFIPYNEIFCGCPGIKYI